MGRCVLICGHHLHVWQWLAGPACLAVGWFTACWMDIGGVWSIRHQSDICLAFSVNLSSPLEPQNTEVREQNLETKWFCLEQMSSPTHVWPERCVFLLPSQLWHLDDCSYVYMSLRNLGFCSTCKSLLSLILNLRRSLSLEISVQCQPLTICKHYSFQQYYDCKI